MLSTHGNTRLGGDDLDRRLTDFLLEEIRKEHPSLFAAENPILLARVREVAEAAKCRLSDENEVDVSFPFLTPEISFTSKLTRENLERLTRDLIEQTRAHCLRALGDAHLKPEELTEVILVGGQTRMPLVRRMVEEIFGREPNTSINPDEAVALGAAIQAEILSGGFQSMLLLDVTPLSLGIETFGGLMNVIIPRNSTIPIKAGELFTTAVDRQKSMLVHVLQGERELAKDNWSLGRFEIEFEPAPRGVPRVGIQFEIDANGILHVLARDIKTGVDKKLEVQSAVDVSEEAVEKMIEDSLENAFDDLSQRRWIAAKLKAEEMQKATHVAIQQAGKNLSEEELVLIQEGLKELEAALATENPQSKVGELNKLKLAIQKLDAVTQRLATILMETVLKSVSK